MTARAAKTSIKDHIQNVIELLDRGARMNLSSIPDDPTFLSSKFGPDVSSSIAAILRDSLKEQVFAQPEFVEVREEEDGALNFYVSTRDGFELIGPEINMAAITYNVGTRVVVHEPLEIDET